MATGKKAKRKTKPKPKPKRKKAPVTEATTRRKTTTVRKKPAKKARRPSPKKAKPTANTVAKSTPVSPPAQPIAATPTLIPPVQFAPPEERIGVVTHYYGHLSVATLRLESGTLRVGDVIHIRGHTTDFSQQVESLEVNHSPASAVGPNDDFGLKVAGHVREHDVVYKVRQ
jgi:hypothetical protein